MLRPRSLAVVALLAASSLLTLFLMGLSQWIQAILVIAVELSLGLVLHGMTVGSEGRAASLASRRRPGRHLPLHAHKRKAPHGHGDLDRPEPTVGSYAPVCRLMFPIRDDRPDLVAFAIRECLSHRAELDLVFVRVLTVVRMGPGSEPTEFEDEEAHALIERIRGRVVRAGVPCRSDYVVTSSPSSAIVELATIRNADLLLMPAPRRDRGVLSKLWVRDEVRDVLAALPEHVGLLIHA